MGDRQLTTPPGRQLPRSFYDRPVLDVARELLGAVITHAGVSVRLTEVEAYAGGHDPASHAFRGRTPRTAVMFGPPGFVYVYRSYGIHWCVNFVCEKAGSASAVLIRALQPTHGIRAMRRRRGLHDDRSLCSGPGKLTEAAVYQKAARLTLKLVSEHGGEAIANTAWSVVTPSGC